MTGLLLLAACSGTGGPGEPKTPPTRLELPPPLSETESATEAPARPPVDPDRWLLPDPQGDPEHPPWFRLFWSQENQAELEACGCPGSPTGGMARRAALAAELRATLPDVTIVEGPSALSRAILGFGAVEGEHRARGRVVLETLAASQPDAFFPGHADFAVMTTDELAAAAKGHGIPLVATNLDASGYQRSMVREVEGRRVLFLGLVREAGTHAGLAAAPTTDAVAAAAAEVAAAGPVDLVVALTDGDRRTVRQWREAGLDVDVLLTPPEPSDSRAQLWDGTMKVVRADPLGRAFRRLDVAFTGGEGRGLWPTERMVQPVERVASLEGQYLRQRRTHRALVEAGEDPRQYEVGSDGERRLDPSTDPDVMQGALAEIAAMRRQAFANALELTKGHAVHVSKVVMEPAIQEHPGVRDRLDAVGAERLRALQADQEPFESVPEASRYVGRTACVSCHAPESAHWSQSPHAQAWKTLLERGETENPDCLRCHTTGFAAAGGFADPTGERALLNVECEACHGPMARHVEEAARRGFAPSAGQPITETVCRRCHDPANSPRFDYSTYLPRVMHKEPR
ncbi:MAG: hypothetical protein GY898_18965 [Proteobacteria bacterium]|nr:hypothetical protein [Pseudomonadota bacterium]